jgi:hypothetical protein
VDGRVGLDVRRQEAVEKDADLVRRGDRTGVDDRREVRDAGGEGSKRVTRRAC